MAATDTLTSSILQYIDEGAYPESEDIASATLSSTSLAAVLSQLKNSQEDVRNDIRALSRTTAPDIDSWISRAKELQADILRSRDTARQIVQDAEAGKEIHAAVDDTGKKVGLLEKEVRFNETLTGTLEHVQYANGLLERTQEEAIVGNIEKSLRMWEDAEASIAALETMRGSRAIEVLGQRKEELKRGLVETSTECWDELIQVNVEERRLKVKRKGIRMNTPDAVLPELTLDAVVIGLKGLDVLDDAVRKLAKDVERTVVRPRIEVDGDGLVAKVSISHNQVSCSERIVDVGPEALFKDLHSILNFLATHLPPTITIPLSTHLIPPLASHLESQYLDSAIPVSMSGIPAFQDLLFHVSALADYIDRLSWNGTETLREWVQNAPRAWLTKRREAVLGDVRNLVFEGLRERKVVERVETRMVSADDAGMVGGEEDWDTAWDEAEDEQDNKDAVPEEDDDASAWDVDDDASERKEEDGDGDDDAWGWGDEENTTQKVRSPIAARKHPTAQPSKPTNGEPAKQEMTLRETFTVTAIPDGILAILQNTVSDASSPTLSSSPLAPAATALYTLPTLALAIYRATAPTAYAKVEVGNMLIYNDASRLAEQLRSWQQSQPEGSRLRVDNDVAALEMFAKRAYSSEMDSQRTILRDLLDGAQGFANCTQHPFKSESEGAVDATVDRLRDVHKLWKDVLSQGALLQSLGSLLSTVTGKMISEIEDTGDISEPESQQLKHLCDRVTSVKDIFTGSGPSDSDGGGGDGQDMTFIYCPTWLKFQYLSEILEASLADIRWMWKEGELSLEFDGEEVVELVEALFAESELRRQAVREVRRGGR